jgi:hypothetical protein
MKGQRTLLSVVIVAVLLALVGGVIQAQRPQSPDEDHSVNEIDGVLGILPIQGRLTDAGGNPLSGSHNVTASIYDQYTGGTMLCTYTQSVPVDNGLFNMYMHDCSSSDIDGKQLYLGISVGSDPEMSPRQLILPVPYAWSLRPGAIISGITSGAIVHIENGDANGRGLRAYATSTTGENYGVVGASKSPDGYGGYFYNTSTGDGVYGEGRNGVYGEGGYRGVYGEGSQEGVYGCSDTAYGTVGYSHEGVGVQGRTGRPDQNYGLHTMNNLGAANFHETGAQMQVVQNGGQEALEPGDVVIFDGLVPGDPPVIQVAKATVANSTAVAGVVYSRYNLEAMTEGPEQGIPGDWEVTPAGPVPPGEYLLVVVQGPAQVKASALAGAIHPGDLLSSAGPAGQAAMAAHVSIEGVKTAVPGTVFGKALEALDQGDKLIYVFVTLQ